MKHVEAAIENLRGFDWNSRNRFAVFPLPKPSEQDLRDVEALLLWKENRPFVRTREGAIIRAHVLYGWLCANRAME